MRWKEELCTCFPGNYQTTINNKLTLSLTFNLYAYETLKERKKQGKTVRGCSPPDEVKVTWNQFPLTD